MLVLNGSWYIRSTALLCNVNHLKNFITLLSVEYYGQCALESHILSTEVHTIEQLGNTKPNEKQTDTRTLNQLHVLPSHLVRKNKERAFCRQRILLSNILRAYWIFKCICHNVVTLTILTMNFINKLRIPKRQHWYWHGISKIHLILCVFF